jgi:hypothetical protein
MVVLMNLSAFGENLLCNADFSKQGDSNFSGWNNYYGRGGLIRRSISVDGKSALLLDSTTNGDVGGVTQIIKNINPTDFYQVKILAKKVISKDCEGAFLQLRFLLPDKKIRLFQTQLNPKSESSFDEFFVAGKAPENAIGAQVFIYIQRNKKTAIVLKNVKFEKIDSKNPISLGKRADMHFKKCPETIPTEWLSPELHPSVFCNKSELATARKKITSTDYGRQYLQKQKKLCREIINMNDEQLRALVPKPGSLIVYGLGMNLCPQGSRLRWGGIKKPFTVYGKGNIAYPNKDFPDDGTGWKEPETGKKYLFIANVNGFIHKYLEQKILPALADVYALTGDKKYAHTAAVLLDAIAAAYPKNRRGPLDYPTSQKDYDRGGRLDRPYYQTARGLFNYVNTVDLIASSGELEKASKSTNEKSIRDNVIRNLLWDGGLYCLDHALEGKQLHNGHADYLRGAGMVGVILNQRFFAEPMLEGPLSMSTMLDINIDRNGFYTEVSPSYGIHAAELYISIAELIEAAKALNWKNVSSVYADPALNYYLSGLFNRREVGGHMPAIGDDGPDRYYNSPLRRLPGEKYVHSDRFLKNQINGAWVMLVRGKKAEERLKAASILRNSFGGKKIIPPDNRWAIYHISPKHMSMIEKVKEDPAFFDSNSAFYGAKGLALLRGGEGEKRFGAQLSFGLQNNHGQKEILSWTFFDRGAEWSYDPGYFNTHYRFGWTCQSIAHQMVTVDGQSYDVSDAGGFMSAWLDTPSVQWVFAEHPGAYSKQGVKRYERLIAQAINPENGRLGYWLDVSRVEGGKFRDDSFHTVMTLADVSVELEPMKEFSLYGDMYKKCSFQNDYRLDKFKEKPFYWTPPGDGYGFLVKPRQKITSESVHAIFKSPGFKELQNKGTLIAVDFPGEQRRNFILADSMKARGALKVPYVIRRDKVGKSSVFAKVIRTFDATHKDHIIGVENVKVEKGPAIARAYLIKWRNGLSDLWVISESGKNVAVAPEKLPKVYSDGLVAMIRFDKDQKVIAINSSCASFLKVDGQKEIKGKAEYRGQIQDILRIGEHVAFKVKWFDMHDSIYSGLPLVTQPEKGMPVTWRIAEVDGCTIQVEGVKPIIGSSTFSPCQQEAGWYFFRPPLSRFFDRSNKIIKKFAIGKAVYNEGKFLGTITDVKEGKIKIENGDKPVKIEEFFGKVFESMPGDKFTIPLNLHWESQ